MKNILYAVLSTLLLLSACAPAAGPEARAATPPAIVAATPGVVAAPSPAGACTAAPHEVPAQGIPIPNGLVVRELDDAGLALIWRDGTALGRWATTNPPQENFVHVVGSSGDPFESLALVYVAADESGLQHLEIGRGEQVARLVDLPAGAMVGGLAGIAGQAVIAYSVFQPSPDGGLLISRLYLGEIETLAKAAPALTVESRAARYIVPLAIHRDGNESPDGLWYTYRPWGIGGDSLTDPQEGLYFLDLASGAVLEFLGAGCGFSDLSTGQDWAAWASRGAMHVIHLRSGAGVSFPLLEGNDRLPAHAAISPGGYYVAWLEGRGWEYDGSLETVLRIGTTEGLLLADMPRSAFVVPAGLGADIAIVPLGWMQQENESLVVMAYSVARQRAVLLAMDIGAGTISVLAEATLAGFAYP